MELPDGTILPSWMKVASGAPSGAVLAMNDPYLRIGRVARIHYPEQATNANKRATEYDVEVQYADIGGAHTTQVYPRCQVVSLFGAIADQSRFTPRRKTSTPNDEANDEGSLVLLLCVNGNSRQGVILGGFPHPQVTPDKKEDGHNLSFSFNGISFKINKDGELTVQYRGATKDDGTLDDNANANAEGSTVTFLKDGSVQIQTKDDNQHILVDHANHKLDIKTDTELHITSNGNVNIESKGVKAGGAGANEAFVLGTTYRQNESQWHGQLQAQLGVLSGLIATAGASLTTAAAAHVTPIAGPIIGAPALAAAAAAITSMVSSITALQTAVTQMEARTADYLSKKNFGDP